MNGAIVRVILRYFAGGTLGTALLQYLFGIELAANFMTDPDVLLIVSGVISAFTETYWHYAKKFGWPT